MCSSDLPPGTNELHIKIVEEFGDSGVALLVSHEDALAMADTFRALDFFAELSLPPVATVLTQIGRRGVQRADGVAPRQQEEFMSAGEARLPVVRVAASELLARTPLDLSRIELSEGFGGVADTADGRLRSSFSRLAELCDVEIQG